MTDTVSRLACPGCGNWVTFWVRSIENTMWCPRCQRWVRCPDVAVTTTQASSVRPDAGMEASSGPTGQNLATEPTALIPPDRPTAEGPETEKQWEPK